MADGDSIRVEVAYATVERQLLIEIGLPWGSDVRRALEASGILHQLPELTIDTIDVGIFGGICRLDTTLNNGDRVEIYRSLHQDPMTARRRRLKN